VHPFIDWGCYGIIIVMGLESVSFCCLELSWDNNVHLFIVKSCHGIIMSKVGKCFFSMLGVVMG
jgi:hypothetical protein